MFNRILAWALVVAWGTWLCQDALGVHRAVVIGVQSYDRKAVPNLRFCVNDAVRVSQALVENCGYSQEDVLLLHSEMGSADNPATTHANLQTKITAWLSQAKPDDTVLFYFSGHGFLHENACVLATFDYNPADPPGTGISSTWLHEKFRECKAQHQLMILDCCHAGSGTKGSKEVQRQLEEMHRKSKGLVVIGSCADRQFSYEWEEKEMGVFSYHLVDGLKGKANTGPDHVVDHVELFTYLQTKVSRTASTEIKNGGPQTPIIFHDHKTYGAFPLASVKVPDVKPVLPQAIPTPQIAANPAPVVPPESQRGPFAFQALRDGKSANPAADALTLVSEAADLRTPQIERARISTQNPYFVSERADEVYEWLLEARKHVTALSAEQQTSLNVSLALAAWYRTQQDADTARQTIDQVSLAALPAEPYVRLPLMLVYAASRKTDRQGKLDALNGYIRILDFLEESDQRTASVQPILDFHELSGDLVFPAYGLGNDLHARGAIDDKALARVLGRRGQLVETERTRFTEAEINSAMRDLERAVKLHGENPRYLLSLANLLLPRGRSDDAASLQKARGYAQQAQVARPSDPLGAYYQLAAFRIAGDTWQRESRLMATMPQRLEKLSFAIAEYGKAVQAGVPQYPTLAGLQRHAKQHYEDCLLSRSAAYLHQANLTDLTRQQRRELLQKAIDDADLAARDGTERGYFVQLAKGNALEDCAWLCGELSAYPKAIEAFRKAQEEKPFDAQAFLSLARCRFKWGMFGKQPGQMEDAKRLLEIVKKDLREDRALAEAHFWTAKIFSSQGNFRKAEEDLALAWSGDTRPGAKSFWIGMKDPNYDPHNKAVCLHERSNNCLDLARGLIAAALPAKGAVRTQGFDAQKTEEIKTALSDALEWSQELKSFSDYQIKATIVQATALAIGSEFDKDPYGKLNQSDEMLKKAINKIAEQRAQLDVQRREALRTKSDTRAIDAQDLCLSQDEARLRSHRADLLWCTKWKQGDIERWELEPTSNRQKLPLAIACADDAAGLLQDAEEKAQARGLAGLARYDVRLYYLNKEREVPPGLTLRMEQDLKEAVALAPNHPKGWAWKKALAEWLIFDQQTKSPEVSAFVKRILNEALVSGCPESVKTRIRALLGSI